MRTQQYVAGILFLLLMTSCTKDFDLQLEPGNPLYVIEGKISNLWGPYYVRITKTAGLEPFPGGSYIYHDSAEAVKNAQVIISDDTGVRDTLIPGTHTLDRFVYYFRDSVNYTESSIDSFFTTVGDRSTTIERGFYQTTKIKGQPGHTYYLEVRIGDAVFKSSAYMPPVTELERVTIRDTVLPPFTNRGNIPVAWFKDPSNEKNYYGLKINGLIHGYRYDDFLAPGVTSGVTFNALPYYVFDDKLLGTDLNGIAVRHVPDNYVNPYPLAPEGYPYFRITSSFQVRLHSFSKEAYDYFNVLVEHLQKDGNTFKPAPASAPGNISGGALGLFYATGISAKLTDFKP